MAGIQNMAECPKHSYDPSQTVMVSNYPPDVGEEELTIYFQNEKNGGGNVEEVVLDRNIAFLFFVCLKVSSVLSYLNCSEHLSGPFWFDFVLSYSICYYQQTI